MVRFAVVTMLLCTLAVLFYPAIGKTLPWKLCMTASGILFWLALLGACLCFLGAARHIISAPIPLRGGGCSDASRGKVVSAAHCAACE